MTRVDQAGDRRGLVAVLVFIAMVTAIVSSLGAPLLPSIARIDRVGLGEAQWSLTITMLVGAVSAPVMGRLGDGPRRRAVILASLGVVVLGSVLAALPGGGFALLVTGRAMQGFGLGLMPLTMAVARDHLPAERARSTIALLSIAGAAGVGFGYPITGVFDETLGLSSAFWFGAVVAAAALLAGARVLPRATSVASRPLDVPGAVLLGAGLLGLLLAITEGRSWGWTSPPVVGLGVVAVVGGVLWIRRERSTDHPLVELSLLRHRAVTVANLAGVLIAMAMYMFLPLLTDYVQTPRSSGYGFGASVVVAGLMLLPFSLLSTSMSRVAAWFGYRFGDHRVIPVGSLVLAAAVASFGATGGALWQAFAAMALAGVGIGFTFAAMPGLIVRAVPMEETGSALGFYQVVRYVGFAVGSALSATMLAAYTPDGRLFPARAGFTTALLVGAGLCLLTAAVSLWLSRGAEGLYGRRPAGSPGEAPATAGRVSELVHESGELAAAGLAEGTETGTVRAVIGGPPPARP